MRIHEWSCLHPKICYSFYINDLFRYTSQLRHLSYMNWFFKPLNSVQSSPIWNSYIKTEVIILWRCICHFSIYMYITHQFTQDQSNALIIKLLKSSYSFLLVPTIFIAWANLSNKEKWCSHLPMYFWSSSCTHQHIHCIVQAGTAVTREREREGGREREGERERERER